MTKGGKWIPGHDSKAKAAARAANSNLNPKKPIAATKPLPSFLGIRSKLDAPPPPRPTWDKDTLVKGGIVAAGLIQTGVLMFFPKFKEDALNPIELVALGYVIADEAEQGAEQVPIVGKALTMLGGKNLHVKSLNTLALIFAPRLAKHGLLPKELADAILATGMDAVPMEEGGTHVNSGGDGERQDDLRERPPVGTPIRDDLADEIRQSGVRGGSQETDPSSVGDGFAATQSNRTLPRVPQPVSGDE